MTSICYQNANHMQQTNHTHRHTLAQPHLQQNLQEKKKKEDHFFNNLVNSEIYFNHLLHVTPKAHTVG